jgi:hypothetical protein
MGKVAAEAFESCARRAHLAGRERARGLVVGLSRVDGEVVYDVADLLLVGLGRRCGGATTPGKQDGGYQHDDCDVAGRALTLLAVHRCRETTAARGGGLRQRRRAGDNSTRSRPANRARYSSKR